MVHSRRPWYLLGLVVFLTTLNLKAQLNRGVIEGNVTDPQVAVVPNVDVKVTNVDTNVTATVKTNNDGYYRVADLVPGKYKVHFELAGFRAVDISNIQVPAGQVMRVDTQLRLGATLESVEVNATTSLIETAPANFSTTLGDRTVQDMPLQGRDIQQLVFLIPGQPKLAVRQEATSGSAVSSGRSLTPRT